MLLYRELIKLNISPLEVDRMTMWQIGSLFDDADTPAAVRPYSEGGLDPHLLARIEQAKRGEGIALVPVPPRNPQPRPDVESRP